MINISANVLIELNMMLTQDIGTESRIRINKGLTNAD
uniref:Uncharacterized protein n=1 Tax=Anguilla anguilla TaxID=7936 RepID=A0A0E9UJY7_ANGAN